MTNAPIFPGPRFRTAAERFCYTSRRQDFPLLRED
jgi:hypothetical protein